MDTQGPGNWFIVNGSCFSLWNGSSGKREQPFQQPDFFRADQPKNCVPFTFIVVYV